MRLIRGATAAALAAPALALAHGAVPDWHVAPGQALPVLVPGVLAGVLYLAGVWRRAGRRGLQRADAAAAASYAAASLLLAMALVWPLDAWAGISFAAHMGQHMVLLALAPPLLLAARPFMVVLHALPPALRRAAVAPRRWRPVRVAIRASHSVAGMALLHGALIWGWHAPRAFEAAVRHDGLHALEHVSLLAGGLLFWRALALARQEAAGAALAWTLVTLIHTGLLAALLTLAPVPLYGLYAARVGDAAALADQQLAGLIMWVPMGAVYIVCALQVASRWLAEQPPGGPA